MVGEHEAKQIQMAQLVRVVLVVATTDLNQIHLGRAILLQHHPHKVIMVEMEQLMVQHIVMAVAAAVPAVLEEMLQHFHQLNMEELVEQDLLLQ